MIIYVWLLDFYVTFFDNTTPIPDYIDEALHWFAFAMLVFVFIFPFLVIYFIGKLVSSVGGRGRYE